MMKKSLIQGLLITILFYLVVIALYILEINPLGSFVFTTQGFFLTYIFISIGTLAYMRL